MKIERPLLDRLLDRLPGLNLKQAVETAIRYYLDVAESVEAKKPAGKRPFVERRDPGSPGARLRNGPGDKSSA